MEGIDIQAIIRETVREFQADADLRKAVEAGNIEFAALNRSWERRFSEVSTALDKERAARARLLRSMEEITRLASQPERGLLPVSNAEAER